DFTRLATRRREAGMTVIGSGEKKTLNPFITAFGKVIYIEILKQQAGTENESENETPTPNERSEKTNTVKGKAPLSTMEPKMIRLIADSISDLADDDGWAFLGNLGNLILKKQPDFDPRNYGFSK